MKQFTKQDLNKTLYVKKDIVDRSRKWYQIDATGLSIWRLAVVVSQYLMGKNKATAADFWDAWDFVVVQNVDKMVYTGNKGVQKKYYRYSGYKGNVKSLDLETLMQKDPSKVLWYAVKWMLPKNKLRKKRLARLKSFVWTSTKFDYMKPELIETDYLQKTT